MSSEEKKTTFDEEDPDVPRKEVSRGTVTKLMGMAAITLLLLVFFYVVHLHVRLERLEQCQRVAETITTKSNVDVDDNDETDKVRNYTTCWL